MENGYPENGPKKTFHLVVTAFSPLAKCIHKTALCRGVDAIVAVRTAAHVLYAYAISSVVTEVVNATLESSRVTLIVVRR
jgi:hypothetical protein